MQLLQVLEKVVLGAVRYQLRAPHYAVVMGVMRVPRDVYHAEPRKETLGKAQSLPGEVESEAGKEAEESAPIAAAEALPDTEESKKMRIAAIASMFGLDSSSSEGDSGSDSDGEGGGGSHGSVGEEGSGALGKRSRGNSLSSSSGGNPNESENELDEEDGNFEGDAAMEVDGALDEDAGGADGADKADVQHATGIRNKAKAALVDPLELSCRVYVLLATLVRLVRKLPGLICDITVTHLIHAFHYCRERTPRYSRCWTTSRWSPPAMCATAASWACLPYWRVGDLTHCIGLRPRCASHG
jgi:hypothetical protein